MTFLNTFFYAGGLDSNWAERKGGKKRCNKFQFKESYPTQLAAASKTCYSNMTCQICSNIFLFTHYFTK